MNNPTKFFHKKDILIVLILLILSALAWIAGDLNASGKNLSAYIYYDNVLVRTIDLSHAEDGFFSIDEKPDVVFEIKDKSIGFIESSCPDKICIKAGFLNKDGQIAVCLPNKLILKVSSNDRNRDDNLPDIISR